MISMTCTIRRHPFASASGTRASLLALALLLFCTSAVSATITVDCDAGQTIGKALATVHARDTLVVSGTCNENLIVQEEASSVTLDGQGRATINGGADKTHTVIVRGRRIVIKGFTVTGGRDGIHLAGGSADIFDTVIRNVGLNGIFVDHNGLARLLDSRIEGNRGAGIVVNENSVTRIGFLIGREKGHPNIITGNALDGIVVQRSSTAWVAGVTITGNKGNGVTVDRNSQATFGDNTIDGNRGDAFHVSRMSGLTLGSMDIRDDAPNTTRQKNGGFGVRCSVGGYVDGPIGTLAGAKGAKQFDKACIDGTN